VTLEGGLNSTFSSLRVRNYRIFFLTQVVSTNGTWMQRVAQFWLVLHLTGSGVALGVTSALQFVPMLLLSSWGGLIADRGDKRVILVATQIASSVLSFTLAALTLTGVVQLWMVYVLAFCLGIVNVVDSPTRQSFVTEMVGAPQVPNAIGLNSAVFTSARMLGPAIAGVVITLVGTGWCFLYNGFSFFPVVAGLLLMRPSELHRTQPTARTRGQIVQGMRYAWSRYEVRVPLLLTLVIGTLAYNFNVVLPLLARFTFQSGASTFGALMSMLGVGALVGALVSAARAKPTQRMLAFACLAFGTLLLVAAVAPSLVLEMIVLIPVGFAMVTSQATANSLIQTNSDAALRGRVMALFITAWVGTTPIGAPIVGWICQEFGPRAGLAVGGAATVVAALVAIRVLPKRRSFEPGQTRTVEAAVSE
jgi:MFS family permease